MISFTLLGSIFLLTSYNNEMIKYVLVTGANKGIGKAICQKLVNEYPEVHVLLASRSKERGEAAVKDIASDRVSLVEMDVASDDSVKAAASQVKTTIGSVPLYGIVNNAGVAWNHKLVDVVNINFFGTKRVCEAFGPLISRPGGRIVNIASASGPMFVNGDCHQMPALKRTFAEPLGGSIENLVDIAHRETSIENAYGFSKALVNAYTALLAKESPDLIVNSCTPGYIKTDLAPSGTSTVEHGAKTPVKLLMDPAFNDIPTGRYYGSDGVRSPLDRYRGPGDPPFEGP